MFTFDNANLIVDHNLNGRDKTAIVEWDLAGKKEIKVMTENADYDMGGIGAARSARCSPWPPGPVPKANACSSTRPRPCPTSWPRNSKAASSSIYGEDDSETEFLVWAGND